MKLSTLTRRKFRIRNTEQVEKPKCFKAFFNPKQDFDLFFNGFYCFFNCLQEGTSAVLNTFPIKVQLQINRIPVWRPLLLLTTVFRLESN